MIIPKPVWSFSRQSIFDTCKYKYYYTYIASRENGSLLERLRNAISLEEYLFFSFKEIFQSLIMSQNWLHKENEFKEQFKYEITKLNARVNWEFLHPNEAQIVFYEHIYCSEKWSNHTQYLQTIQFRFKEQIQQFLKTTFIQKLITTPSLSWCRITTPMSFDFMEFSILFAPLLILQESGTSRCFDLSLYEKSTNRAMEYCNLFALYATLNLYVEPKHIQYQTMGLNKCEILTLAPTIEGMIQLKESIQNSYQMILHFPWHGPTKRAFYPEKQICNRCKFKLLCY
jgi:hypothetical protein